MASQKPVIHGRDHRTGGSDPVFDPDTDAIRFNTLNVGDWLNVETTTATGITLNATGGGGVAVGGTAISLGALAAASLGAGTTLGLNAVSGATISSSSGTGQLFIDGHDDVLMRGYKGMTIESFDDVNYGMLVSSAMDAKVRLVLSPVSASTASSFEIFTFDGTTTRPIFRVDSDGTTHTVGVVIPDL